jgi:hypothetical protein
LLREVLLQRICQNMGVKFQIVVYLPIKCMNKTKVSSIHSGLCTYQKYTTVSSVKFLSKRQQDWQLTTLFESTS